MGDQFAGHSIEVGAVTFRQRGDHVSLVRAVCGDRVVDLAFTLLRQLDGVLRIGFADGERDVTAGQTVDIPRGTVHQMWNPTDKETRVRWLNTPAGRVEPYFAAMDRLNRAGKAGPLGYAVLLGEYQDVMRPASPLARSAMRVLAPLGRLLGATA